MERVEEAYSTYLAEDERTFPPSQKFKREEFRIMMKILNTWGLISVTGPDRAKFLQGQLSCDVLNLPVTQSVLGVHCSAKGRIIADFRLWHDADQFFLFLPRVQIPILLKALKKYALFSKVALSDVSDSYTLNGFVASSVDTLQLPQHHNDVILSPPHTVICISEQPARFLMIRAKDEQITLANTRSDEEWLLDDIQLGLPHIFPESVELFTPHQINYQLLGGISFKKGCYTGQEVIARMQYLGKLKQRMYHAVFKSTSVILPGTPILKHDQEVGQMVMCASTQEALIVLRDECVAEPELLLFKDNMGSIERVWGIEYRV